MKKEALENWYNQQFEELMETPPTEVWNEVKSSIPASSEDTTTIVPISRKKRSSWMIAAAAVALLAVGGTTAWVVSQSSANNLNGLQYSELVELHGTTTSIEFSTNAELDIVELEDGTLVYLRKGSRLNYPENFSSDARNVILEGEAFFDVARDENRPFSIFAGNTKTEVLGTSFNLDARKEADAVTLNVSSGHVRMSIEGQDQIPAPVELVVDEQGVFDQNTNQLQKQSVEHQSSIAWTQDRASIRQTAYYQQEATALDLYSNQTGSWKKTDNTTIFSGSITNSSKLLIFEQVILRATYLDADGNKIASKFFELEQSVKSGETVNYEQIENDWVDGTAQIEVAIEDIQLH